MKVIYNSIIPFKGFYALSFCGLVFMRKEYKGRENSYGFKCMMNHEKIHLHQQRELLYIFFFLIYIIEWVVLFIKYKNWIRAYRHISFEREAFEKEEWFNYCANRRHFAQWRRYE